MALFETSFPAYAASRCDNLKPDVSISSGVEQDRFPTFSAVAACKYVETKVEPVDLLYPTFLSAVGHMSRSDRRAGSEVPAACIRSASDVFRAGNFYTTLVEVDFDRPSTVNRNRHPAACFSGSTQYDAQPCQQFFHRDRFADEIVGPQPCMLLALGTVPPSALFVEFAGSARHLR